MDSRDEGQLASESTKTRAEVAETILKLKHISKFRNISTSQLDDRRQLVPPSLQVRDANVIDLCDDKDDGDVIDLCADDDDDVQIGDVLINLCDEDDVHSGPSSKVGDAVRISYINLCDEEDVPPGPSSQTLLGDEVDERDADDDDYDDDGERPTRKEAGCEPCKGVVLESGGVVLESDGEKYVRRQLSYQECLDYLESGDYVLSEINYQVRGFTDLEILEKAHAEVENIPPSIYVDSDSAEEDNTPSNSGVALKKVGRTRTSSIVSFTSCEEATEEPAARKRKRPKKVYMKPKTYINPNVAAIFKKPIESNFYQPFVRLVRLNNQVGGKSIPSSSKKPLLNKNVEEDSRKARTRVVPHITAASTDGRPVGAADEVMSVNEPAIGMIDAKHSGSKERATGAWSCPSIPEHLPSPMRVLFSKLYTPAELLLSPTISSRPRAPPMPSSPSARTAQRPLTNQSPSVRQRKSDNPKRDHQFNQKKSQEPMRSRGKRKRKVPQLSNGLLAKRRRKQSTSSEARRQSLPRGRYPQPTRSAVMPNNFAEELTLNERLIKAVMKGNLPDVMWCVKKGADVNTYDSNDQSPLHHAALTGHRAVVLYLLDHGASIDSRDTSEMTPLLMAVRSGFLDVVRALVGRGADLGARNVFGSSALHIAVIGNWEPIVQFLLERGADTEAMDNEKCSPLLLACIHRFKNIIALIRKFQSRKV